MTSVILVIIGILLAASAALFVVFYGGDAFNAGNNRAAAASIVNMGQNVRHAADLYRSMEGGDADGVSVLVAKGYLSQAPQPGALGSALDAWRQIRPSNTSPINAYVITGVDQTVCLEINRQTVGRDEVVEVAGVSMGCVADGPQRYFFVAVGKVGDLERPG